MGNAHIVEHNDSIGGLIRGILTDIRELMREELALARVEMRDQAARVKMVAACFGSAALALGIGLVFLFVSIALGIADAFGWPAWAGYLTMAVLLSASGALGLVMGRKRLRTVHAVPPQTVQTLKENSAWIAKRLSSDRK